MQRRQKRQGIVWRAIVRDLPIVLSGWRVIAVFLGAAYNVRSCEARHGFLFSLARSAPNSL